MILTAQQVADYAKVKKRRILEAARKGELESINVGKGIKYASGRRFTQAAVDRWLKSLTEGNDPLIL